MNTSQLHDLYTLIQVSYPIQILSILSTVTTLVVVIFVAYLIRKNSSNSLDHEGIRQTPGDVEELFLQIKDWDYEKHENLLSTFLLPDEFSVLTLLIGCLKEDGLSLTYNDNELKITGDGGWRNKHQISEGTGFSSRKIYDKNGIIERLENLCLLEMRDKDGWGQQTNQYRANINHALVGSMYAALLKS